MGSRRIQRANLNISAIRWTYTGTNLQCVAMFFKDTLSETFNVEGPLSDMSALVDFYKTIRDVFVNITVISSSVAYEMFITANREVPLNNFDIFRGLIITRGGN